MDRRNDCYNDYYNLPEGEYVARDIMWPSKGGRQHPQPPARDEGPYEEDPGKEASSALDYVRDERCC